MTTFNGQRVTQRGGAGAGRGDDAHGVTTSQWQRDQHAIAHADGFIGPRIGEVYGDSREQGAGGMAPTVTGGYQNSPASGFISHNSNGNMGTGDRMAHLDNVLPTTANTRMFQHKATGNIVESWEDHTGTQRVNTYGTSASGRSMQPGNDSNMSTGGSGIDTSSDDYTDITDTVRGTQSYKEGRTS